MTCGELQPDYVAYALGIADEPERGEIADHLARNCPNCGPGVASAMATVAAMSGIVNVAQPPARLRKRVLASIERAPSSGKLGTLLPWIITAMVSIALVTIGITGRRESGDTSKLQRALPILNDPGTRGVTFGEAGKPSHGRVFVNPKMGVVFLGAGLPSIDSNKTFQLWVIPAKRNPITVGLFQSQSDATAVYVHAGAVEDVTRVEVTVEAAGGSAQPSTTPIVVARLQGQG